MTTRIYSFATLAILASSFICNGASGDFIMLNDGALPSSADGMNITRDTTTNLEWLDLTITLGSSFIDTSTQIASGGSLEGFRYATTSEVLTLWSNFGFSPGSGGGFNPGITDAVSFLGNTSTGVYSATGFFDDSDSGTDVSHVGWARAFNHPTWGSWQADCFIDNHTRSIPKSESGSYLVRSVPEPSSFSLFAMLLPFAANRRRRIIM